MLIDSHCHLDASEFDADREPLIQRSLKAGVHAMVVPAVDVGSFARIRQLAWAYPNRVWPAYGLHPIYIADHREEHLDTLRQWLAQEHPVAVGEIGLDGFVSGLDFARQEWLFERQLHLAQEAELPVILHVRHAVDAILKHLRRVRVTGGIAHAFNGSVQQAHMLMDLGFKLGFGGALTFERALNLRRLVATLPLESIVLETDAPDMAPAWAYKMRNTPEYLPRIAVEIAHLRNMDAHLLAQATTANICAVLGHALRAYTADEI